MSLSPADPFVHLGDHFAALFGGQFERARLIQPATPAADHAGGLAVNHADGVAADEQQDNDVS